MSDLLLTGGAGFHNSFSRGINLGVFTEEHSAAIRAGTFDGLWIADYWTIGGKIYRIADFDYYLRSGDEGHECTDHHVVVVPDASYGNIKMNGSDTTAGGYVGSALYKSGLTSIKTSVTNAFGAEHILTHREYLCNAVTSGKQSGGAWYDSTVEIMTEQMVYGGKVFGSTSNGSNIPDLYTVSCKQLNLFRLRPDLISTRYAWWLRDVVSAAYFAHVHTNGNASFLGASSASIGVRPAFPIY